jgi:membrane-associated phospholipid phosphatase
MPMIKEFFLKFVHHWKVLLKDRAYLVSLILGFAVLAGALTVNYLVSFYQDSFNFASVGDFILDDIPTYNLDFLFRWGFYGVISMIVLYPVLFKPEIAPFVLKTYGILILVRSCFIVLTHVGPPAGFFYGDPSLFEELSVFRFKNDLFFSGHTSVPFLAFLLFKKSHFKWVMLLSSFVMGVTVLLMHVHYSIDVFAAFFIAYGIYGFSDKIFNNLNIRFRKRIKIHGWKAFQRRLNRLRDIRRLRNSGVEVVVEEAININSY